MPSPDTSNSSKPIRYFSTFAVGPDKRVFNLAKEGFPKNEDYIPVNAYTAEVKKEYDESRK